jgi:hypothetical protein
MARYIDADKLEKEINSEKAMSFYDLLDKIHFAPTEDVRPVLRGKWIIDGHHLICPRCEIHFCREDREGDELPNNYCPNCGADMREVEE